MSSLVTLLSVALCSSAVHAIFNLTSIDFDTNIILFASLLAEPYKWWEWNIYKDYVIPTIEVGTLADYEYTSCGVIDCIQDSYFVFDITSSQSFELDFYAKFNETDGFSGDWIASILKETVPASKGIDEFHMDTYLYNCPYDFCDTAKPHKWVIKAAKSDVYGAALLFEWWLRDIDVKPMEDNCENQGSCAVLANRLFGNHVVTSSRTYSCKQCSAWHELRFVHEMEEEAFLEAYHFTHGFNISYMQQTMFNQLDSLNGYINASLDHITTNTTVFEILSVTIVCANDFCANTGIDWNETVEQWPTTFPTSQPTQVPVPGAASLISIRLAWYILMYLMYFILVPL